MTWQRMPEAQNLERAEWIRWNVPKIASWRHDPWDNPPRVLYRAALDGDHRLQLALHYTWQKPTLMNLENAHPTWSDAKCRAKLRDLDRHEAQWGPGDLELVVLTFQDHRLETINIRLPLRPKDVLTRPWDLIKRLVKRAPLERRKTYPASRFGTDRAVLRAAASEHHEMSEPAGGDFDAHWPGTEPLSDTLWANYRISAGGGAGRAHLDWEVG